MKMMRSYAVKERECFIGHNQDNRDVHCMFGAACNKEDPFALDAGFSETLLTIIDRTGKKDSEIYNKANVSRQHFSKIRNNPEYKPTKPTAIALAIALELDMDETLDLIGRAGYTLTRSRKFDVIIMHFIQKRNYNLFEINEMLYEYDQSLLGT